MVAKKQAAADKPGVKLITKNRKARHLYAIEDTYEAGLVLTGTEVKSLRDGRANLGDAYARIVKGEMWLENCHISEYTAGNRYNHDPVRRRKLLMHKREIFKLKQRVEQKGYTLVALSMYFVHGRAKLEIGLAKGKHTYDRREDIKQRDEKRNIARAMRD
jgi:SsrA-binding protein